MKLIKEYLLTSLIMIVLFVFYVSGAFMILIPFIVVCIILKVLSHIPVVQKYFRENSL
ncbi:ABC transporter ATP-binding protein/permease [Pantoea sp. S62]|nr:ABC transporter ATP-binding protein/permease [Pantoea sp. S62]